MNGYKSAKNLKRTTLLKPNHPYRHACTSVFKRKMFFKFQFVFIEIA